VRLMAEAVDRIAVLALIRARVSAGDGAVEDGRGQPRRTDTAAGAGLLAADPAAAAKNPATAHEI